MKTEFRNLAGNAAEILLYDIIGDYYEGTTAKDFLAALEGLGPVAEISLRVNSPGGDVADGFAIYNALVRHSAKITVEIDALAASSAATVAMSGDEIRIAKNAFVMIHDPTVFAWGGADDLRNQAMILDKYKSQIANIYADRSGKDVTEVSALMTAETWFTGQDAVDFGLATSVTENKSVAVNFVDGRFRNAPKHLVQSKDGDFDAWKHRIARKRLALIEK